MSRRLSVLLPNGRHFQPLASEDLTVSVVKKSAAELLLLSVEDSRLFGLAEVDAFGQTNWLKEEQSLADSSILYYKIRFYVDSVLSLTSPAAFEAYFLSAYDSFLKEELELFSYVWKQILAYLLQIFGEDVERDEAETILRSTIPEPLRLTDETTIKEVLDLHSGMKGLSRGMAMIRFLQLAERSLYYGCHSYNVSRLDGQKCLLGVCSTGIIVSPKSREHKMFYWKQLDNLYYKEDKFIIEVHGNRSTVRESLEEVKDPELLKAVSDPTTQVSSVQRRQIRLHTFVCKEAALSKTIWQAAITQHQFFLDQKHRRPRNNVDHTEKIGRLISSSSLYSSLPSLSSLHVVSSTASMPAAKVGDGSSTASLPTVKGRSEEEKSVARERYAKLKSKRFNLENDLREKMKELFVVCLKEAETTGEMPKEVKKALFPGQDIPKPQKKIGTSFSIPEELIKGDRANRLNQLETDVELHKKIVAAAERLAKDKSMNKSVRKKRQKDLQAATLKLKGLEVGLSQLRLSASKPDVSSIGTNRSEASWSGIAIAKSCPTTPHGSIPDLLQQSGDDGIDGFVPKRAPSENSRRSLVQRFSEASSSSSSLGLPPTGQRRSFTQRSTTSDELDNPLASPIYENVGYRSTCYRSSYRQAHYPTIQDEQRRRSASAHSIAREIVPQPVREVAVVATKRIPTSVSCSAGFVTASLDRRETRTQHAHKSNMSQSGSSPSTNRITTFPVSQSNAHYENPLPLFQRPPLTHFPHRGALPPYTLSQSASSGRLQTGTDPHMEALLQYYKTEARKVSQKTATIV